MSLPRVLRPGVPLALLLVIAACRPTPPQEVAPPLDVAAWRDSLEGWHTARVAALTAPYGWTTLVARLPLRDGRWTVGAGRDNDLVVDSPNAPPRLGTLDITGEQIVFRASDTVAVQVDSAPTRVREAILRADRDTTPTTLTHGALRYTVIARGDQRLLRVRDSLATARRQFTPIDRYPADPHWRLVGEWEPYDPPRTLPIVTIIGTSEPAPSPGAIVFTVDGREWRLDAIAEPGARDLFINFRDATSDSTSYPAGRFLRVARPTADGRVVIDFNRATNPPCAFSDYATCPLPPAQNRLTLAIPAGERRYHRAHDVVATRD